MTNAVVSNKLNAVYGYKPFDLDQCVKICDLLGLEMNEEVVSYLFQRSDV